MEQATLIIQVPVELKDVIVNVISQILSINTIARSARLPVEQYTLPVTQTSPPVETTGPLVEKDTKPVTTTSIESSHESYRESNKNNNNSSSIPESVLTPESIPTRKQVEDFLRERNSPVNPGRFYDWMDRHNWLDGRGMPVTDWKAKAIEWEQREDTMPRYGKKTAKPIPMYKPTYRDDLDLGERLLGLSGEKNDET